jgi:hypothetical protein
MLISWTITFWQDLWADYTLATTSEMSTTTATLWNKYTSRWIGAVTFRNTLDAHDAIL